MLQSVIKKTILATLSLGLCLFAFSFPSYALDSDRDQPATLDADEFDIDLQTGVRTYRGNVIYQQGSIKLMADEIVAYLKDGALERAIARGNPASFSQRPEGQDTDTIGTALRIELDDVKGFVVLQNKAKITQDNNQITGKKIIYDMDTEKVKVTSGPRKKPEADKATQTVGSESTKGDSIEADPQAEEEVSRPRLVIPPRKKTTAE
ncbi:MAG: lipopolysaccharide export system protein LptA [Gammaproteobacteria bacterium]|jgi:lipopolysaccharide export system protein LptA